MYQFVSSALAMLGSAILIFALFPYLKWTHRLGFSVARRTLFTFVLYSLASLGILFLLQWWTGWTVLLVIFLPWCILCIPVATLADYYQHRRSVLDIPVYEKRAEHARSEGNPELAQMYETIVQITRERYGLTGNEAPR